MAFDSIIKQSYRLRVLPGIGHNVNILHIIPGRAHIHFISDNPVHHYAMGIVRYLSARNAAIASR